MVILSNASEKLHTGVGIGVGVGVGAGVASIGLPIPTSVASGACGLQLPPQFACKFAECGPAVTGWNFTVTSQCAPTSSGLFKLAWPQLLDAIEKFVVSEREIVTLAVVPKPRTITLNPAGSELCPTICEPKSQ